MRMLTLLLIVFLMSLFGKGKAADHEGPVTYLTYSESGMRHRFEYTFERAEDGTCTISRKEGWDHEDKGPTYEVDPSVADQLWDLVKKYKMLSYKSSYTSSSRILDGKMWHIDAKFAKGEPFYTGGENAWPSGGGVDALEKFLDKLWDQIPPEIEYMRFREQGSTMYPSEYFILKQDDKGTYILQNSSNCDRQKARAVKVPRDFLDELGKIIVEEDMLSYRHDYQCEFDVLDGSSWSLTIRLKNHHTSIYSEGYMAWPDGDGLRRLNKLCRETWEALEKKSFPMPLED